MTARTAILAAILFTGLAAGVGLYTFVYAKGYSYLTNDPSACVNCHPMNDYYDGWIKSTHHAAAVCNDCHAPHDFIGKYATKASNGFWHSWAFTTGRFADTLRARAVNREIAEAACRRCHADMVDAVDGPHGGAALSCIRCHSSVGHPTEF
ncbi:MAG: cytochrome c nitrite reductase small subunit [Myxococcales bacterium]|nr:MAG: cytochrome c nitrite reductase small subunit [Myxococcales bacterium]